MRRVQARIQEMFQGKVDMTDFPNDTNRHFETRALAALALIMTSGLEVTQASVQVTDGYHDMGIDAIFLDETQKKLFLVQSKWRADGAGSITQDEMSNFAQGVQRVLEEDLAGANDKIIAKSIDIDVALTQMGYQIHAIFIHTGNQNVNDYVFRPISQLMGKTNDEISTILLFDEFNFRNIYSFLANGQEQPSINLDDVILSNWGKVDAPFVSYYGTISAATVGEWYKNFGNALFAKNIRFYKGNTDVNEGMKKVLLQEPEKFYYYNNGIKLLCKSIKRKAKDSTTNATNSYALLNSVLYMREVERCLQDKKEQVNSNRERLVCIHANRFILHFILKDKGKSENFNISVIDKDSIQNGVISLVDMLVDQTTQFIDELFPESYPANIFKNSTKCKQLEDKFNTIIHD